MLRFKLCVIGACPSNRKQTQDVQKTQERQTPLTGALHAAKQLKQAVRDEINESIHKHLPGESGNLHCYHYFCAGNDSENNNVKLNETAHRLEPTACTPSELCQQ